MSFFRVLHVNTTDISGGAARAANRIHRAMVQSGIDSRMLVIDQKEPGGGVVQPLSKHRRAILKARNEISKFFLARQIAPTNNILHSINLFSSGLGEWINQSEFDVVNLHWVGGEMLSVEEIAHIRKPIFWTMHDMWPFCGSEHYDDLEHPGRYKSGYFAKNRPQSYSGPDIDAWVWRRKKKAWAEKRFHLISPSEWLANCAMESALLKGNPCSIIPNTLDLEVFRPIPRQQARNLLGFDKAKTYILFGAMASTSDARKGFHLLVPALQKLREKYHDPEHVELVVFGAQSSEDSQYLPFPVRYMGNLYDELTLALLYSAVDVFAAPSMQDNLPNTMVEAMACGTPCVAFEVGGMPEIINHCKTGWLARPFDTTDFAEGLEYFLKPANSRRREYCRESAVFRYRGEYVVSKYLECYESVMGARKFDSQLKDQSEASSCRV